MAFENNVSTTLHAAVAIGATSIDVVKAVAPNKDVPADGRLTLKSDTQIEIITYTGRTDNSTHWTLTGVTKNAESNFGDQAWDSGATCYQALTAADVGSKADLSYVETLVAGAAATTSYEFNRTLVAGANTSLTLGKAHNNTATVHLKQFVAGATETNVKWDFDTADSSSWSAGAFADGSMSLPNTGGATVSKVTSHESGSFALMSDGVLMATGQNSYGNLGLGNTTKQYTWVSTLTGVADVFAGMRVTVAILTDGTVKIAGRNSYGMLGLGYSGSNQTSWVTHPLSGVTGFSSGENTSLFLLSDGTVKGVGRNSKGELGLGHTNVTTSLTTVLTGAGSITMGNESSMVVLTDGTLKGSGFNGFGELGTGNTTNQSSWITSLTGVTKASITQSASFALLTDGTLKAVGSFGYGKFGTGVDSGNTLNWITSLTGVAEMSVNSAMGVALLTDGTLKTSGANWYYNLGLGDTTQRNTWTTALTGVASFTVPYTSIIALLTNSTVQVVGRNTEGYIGTTSSSDVQSWTSAALASSSYPSTLSVESLSAISTTGVATINSITVSETKPTATTVNYALSFDGKSTYTANMDSTALAAYDLSTVTIGSTLDVKVTLATTDSGATPSVDQINVNTTMNGMWVHTTPSPTTYLVYETGTDQIYVENKTGTEEVIKVTAVLKNEALYPSLTLTRVEFTATAGQATKTGLTYTVGSIDCYINGIKQTLGTDFTADDGTSVTFTPALDLNDEVQLLLGASASSTSAEDAEVLALIGL